MLTPRIAVTNEELAVCYCHAVAALWLINALTRGFTSVAARLWRLARQRSHKRAQLALALTNKGPQCPFPRTHLKANQRIFTALET